MLVLLTNSFYKKLNVTGRLVLTIHDEIRTLVKNEDIIKAIYALQLAHLYTRSAFIRAHGLDNIPAGQAWFSAVDVDATCLRKDPSDPQVTPTQAALPLGMTVTAKQLLGQLNASYNLR
jgi:DNA polymerase gamma 1